MGVKISMGENQNFFAALGADVVDLAKKVEAKGYTFKIEFFTFKVQDFKQDIAGGQLFASATSILNGTAQPGALNKSRDAVVALLSSLLEDNPTLISPATPNKPASAIKKAGDIVTDAGAKPDPALVKKVAEYMKLHGQQPSKETVLAFQMQVAASTGTAAPASKMALANATALGQQVAGTSPGSTYRVVAVSARIKMAARIAEGSLSIRLEGSKFLPSELTSLTALGFVNNTKYLSHHFELGNCPAARILGAVLMDCGIAFDSQVTNTKGLTNA